MTLYYLHNVVLDAPHSEAVYVYSAALAAKRRHEANGAPGALEIRPLRT